MEDIEDIGRKVPIITCSRRTDVPMWYIDEYIEYFRQGWVETTNPYNGVKSKISLKTKDVATIFWWSKDFSKWIKKRDEFKEYNNFFQFTITGAPKELEPNIGTTLDERLEQLKFLTETYGVNNMSLRFDPIVIYKKDGEEKDNLENFEKIVSFAASIGLKFVIFSFCKPFRKTTSNMKKCGMELIEPPSKEKHDIIEMLDQICYKYDIEMQACSNPELDVTPATCLNLDVIKAVTDEHSKLRKVKRKPCGQQAGCLCADSRDISDYDHVCYHGCKFCYANPSMTPLVEAT
jgi:hypothetical protein